MRTLPALAVCVLVASAATPMAKGQVAELKVAAPELEGIEDWVNAKPLTLKSLRGQVVALHFWTFG